MPGRVCECACACVCACLYAEICEMVMKECEEGGLAESVCV